MVDWFMDDSLSLSLGCKGYRLSSFYTELLVFGSMLPLIGTKFTLEQTQSIAQLLEKYKRREKKPAIDDYQFLRVKPQAGELEHKRHDSDYYLTQKETGVRYLIELKIGGDLDNKKARSEKEAILEQFAILSNVLEEDAKIEVYFATAYNRFGEGKPWQQERVKQFFAEKELLIGRDFWNFICQSNEGYATVLQAYRESANYIKDALESIKGVYLGKNGESRI